MDAKAITITHRDGRTAKLISGAEDAAQVLVELPDGTREQWPFDIRSVAALQFGERVGFTFEQRATRTTGRHF